jgi:NADPH-dependent 2,4-dienoyl-CoA reductase/sulfur reductase-like enzyme
VKPEDRLKMVVVGGNAAGLVAAVTARRENAHADIKVIAKEPYSPYRRPAIPSLIAGEITGLEEAAMFSPDYLRSRGVRFQQGVEAVRLDVENQLVETLTPASGEADRLPYDTLVLATGSSPAVPRIAGADKRGVCTFTTYDAAREIVELAERSSTAVVVGAGLVGLEIAEALMRTGLEVYFNVRSRILRRLLEPDLSAHLATSFQRRGLHMLTGESIGEIGGGDTVEFVTVGEQKIPASIVIFATGVSPNVDLAQAAGIQLGDSGAIGVDKRMQTSVRGIYAAGDCAESPDLTTGGFAYSPVGSIAAMAGEVAGVNAAGGERETEGFVRAQTDKILHQHRSQFDDGSGRRS